MTGYIHDWLHSCHLSWFETVANKDGFLWAVTDMMNLSSLFVSPVPYASSGEHVVQVAVHARAAWARSYVGSARHHGVEAALGGWEVMCFRRLSFNMRPPDLNLHVGLHPPCVGASLKSCIPPWPLTFMEKGSRKQNKPLNKPFRKKNLILPCTIFSWLALVVYLSSFPDVNCNWIIN